ncbi:MAG: hypothetical protein F6K55_17505 [Moorea sp. SIO4A3]|nr:hypothetical protein [Moorena sp. SIO4A3]
MKLPPPGCRRSPSVAIGQVGVSYANLELALAHKSQRQAQLLGGRPELLLERPSLPFL